MCHFIAPTIYIDTSRQINFVKSTEKLNIIPHTIDSFIYHLETQNNLFNTPIREKKDNSKFYSSPTSAMLISEQLVLGPPCDNWKEYQGGEICSCNIENAIVNDTICPIDSNSKNYKFNNTIGAAGYRPDNHPDVWTLVGPVPISPFTSIITNNIENFSDINLNNNFVLYTNIYSIIGIIFYTILYIANINYDNVIKNKILSFALNVLLVICIIISISIIKD
jgi:hypothetical protein